MPDKATVDARPAIQGIKQARRRAGELSVQAQQRAAAHTVVPEANRSVPSWARGTVVAKPRRTVNFITAQLRGKVPGGFKGNAKRVFGLLEFGGTVKGVRRTRRASAGRTTGPRALRLRSGVMVAAVNRPRRIKGKHMLRGAVERRFTDYQEALLPEMMQAFDQFEHTP